jgi:hypothetical protein
MNLQKVPAFLLDLFRLRTTGQLPTAFGDTVVPTVDVSSMYGSDMQVTSSSSGAAGALPRNVVAGPVGYATRYLGLAGEAVMGAAAGTQLRLTIGVAVPTVGQQFFPLFSTLITAPQAGGSYMVGGLLPYPVVFPPGTALLLRMFGDAAGADHVASLKLFIEDPLRG